MGPRPAPTSEGTAFCTQTRLRDGSRVRIRQIRPSDQARLVSGFERLGPESRYRRFLAPLPELGQSMVHYLTDVDHHDHEAVVALDEQGHDGLGLARYIRNPDRPDTAEVAVTVIDEWQGRGLGTVLLDVISARAREEGITTFTALMLAENKEMLDLLEGLGPVRVTDRSTGTVEVEVPIPTPGVPTGLRRLLRFAARHDVAVPLVRGHGISRARRGR
ncbi:MAG TPA: GNAT family N-acetyltransferase [Solirubrobacteraceae bacterium]|nr:GNAT family N-acetyltransferase [Solirubrobacteraceae bacterium]